MRIRHIMSAWLNITAGCHGPAPDPAEGELSLDDDRIEVIKMVSTVLKKYKETVVTIQVKAIECVEITSEQVARSRFLTFGGTL